MTAAQCQQPLRLRDAFPIWWQAARPWFVGSSRLQALRYVAVCVSLSVLHTLVAVRVSFAQKHFSTALSNKDKAAWMSVVWEFVVIICVFAPIRSLESYAEKRMVAVWRTYLTQAFITAYTSNKAYFHMQLARGTEGTQAGPEDQAVAAAVGHAASTQLLQSGTPSAVAAAQQQAHLTEALARSSSLSSSVLAHSSTGQGLPKLRTLGASLELGQARSPAAATAQQESTPLLLGAQDSSKQWQQQGGASAGKDVAVPGEGAGAGRGVVAGLSDASAQVDNPDQRITADVSNYVQTSVGLVLLLVRKTLNCAAFAGVLWSISPKLVVFLLSYALLGTFGTAAVFGAPLTRLKQKLLRLEADLRFGLVRLRENAEAIAFYGGDVREASDLSSRLVVVLDVLLRRIAWLGAYELWLVVYRYATVLVPSLVLAPEYFAGKIEFGTLTQASFAFNVLEEALRLILEKMEDLSSLAAETARLAGLLAALRAADVDAGGDGTVVGFGGLSSQHSSTRRGGSGQGGRDQAAGQHSSKDGSSDVSDVELADRSETALLLHGTDSSTGAAGAAGGGSARLSRVLRLMEGSEPGLEVDGLTACVPGRHHQATVVCQDLSFKLLPGESLLVMGPSGCCKSSLLRIIAGLWTVGSGTVKGPARPFFLPQKPFMPLGSLRQQLLFPTDCPKAWSTQLHSSTSTAAAMHHTGHDLERQQQQEQQQASESSPLVSSSTAVKPSSAVQRSAGHTRTGSRLSFELPSSATSSSSAAAAADGDGSLALHIHSSMDASSVDQQLQQLLEAVRLGHLLHRFPAGLDTELDWASVLSLGEQQRAALVRLLFHRPLLAFLDEATAALDPKSEAVVYGLISHTCRCYVSVGHRLQLLEWHSHVLVWSAPGHWVKYTTGEYQQRLAAGLEG